MIAVGTSETSIEASRSPRLAEGARPRSGMSPGITAGSTSGLPGLSASAFCASGAKRSAMEVGVGSGCRGASAETPATSRSDRLAGLTMMSD